jgi:hypothetical protein
MGHLEKPYSPSLELEADAFSARTLVVTARNKDELSWIVMGMAITLNILEMVETVTSWVKSDSGDLNVKGTPISLEKHPKANNRLVALEYEVPGIIVIGDIIKQLWIPSYYKLEEFDQMS